MFEYFSRKAWRGRVRAFREAQRGNVAVLFGLSLIPLVGMVGSAVDYSRANSVRADMQAALDATALMLAKNPLVPALTSTQLQTSGSQLFSAQFNRPEAQNLQVTSTYNAQAATVTVTGAVTLNSVFMRGILSLIGNSTFTRFNISASSTVTYAGPQTIALNVAFDSSASMIVGATPNDVTLISNWVSQNWSLVKPSDPPPYGNGTGDNPPCAFACHDVGSSTQPSDIELGLTHAHSAGATTRFDVMIAAAQQLISHVQTETTTNPQLANNTYLFNIYSFDTTLHQWGMNNLNFTLANQAVQSVTPGLDTHLHSAMSQLITTIGTQGSGASSASPLKFLILITDGLQSDRSGNWSGTTGHDSAWNYWPQGVPNPRGFKTYSGANGYAGPISATQCNQIKNNGIILAVLETPYVPLTGQSPNVQPYEQTVRHVIYPGGPGTTSAISTALSNCATPGYYFQATNSSDIATGFLALTDKFIYNTLHILN